MTSKTIVNSVATEMGISQKSASEFIKALEKVVKETVETSSMEDKFKCLDITFSKRDVDGRKGRNPATGEEIDIPATKKLVLKASSDYKSIVRG